MRRDQDPYEASGGHPTARPLRGSTAGKSSLAQGISGSLGETKYGAHTGTIQAAGTGQSRVHARDIDELASWLSERDYGILRSVAEHQFLTVKQIEALHFADHSPTSGARIARRTLARLRDHRLLATLNRRIGGVRAGSAGLVHYVDVVGDRLLRGRSGRQARRSYEPSPRFLNHRLAIADVHVALVKATRRGQLQLVECELEPSSWRHFTGLGGAHLTVRPDMYLETAANPDSDLVRAWFIEVDLGTESVPTLLKKCRDYEAYRQSGIEQAHGGFPPVIWTVTHRDPIRAERRRRDLEKAIEHSRTLTPELFRIIAPEQLVPLLASGGRP
jgi:hypothetical protein